MVKKGRVSVRDGTVPYCRFGNGKKKLVILPGISVTPLVPGGEAVATAFSAFAEDYTMYLFDRTDPLPEGTTVERMAEDAAAAMERLGILRADVFGTSQGAMMALCVAEKHPDLVRALALGSVSLSPTPTSRETFGEWLRLAEAGDVSGTNRAMFRACYSEAFRERCRDALEASAQNGTREDLRRFAVMCRAANAFAFPDLSGIRCPVFAVGGEDDRVLSAAGTRELADKLACQTILYPGGSHAVYDEEPDFLPRMLAFFRSIPSCVMKGKCHETE